MGALVAPSVYAQLPLWATEYYRMQSAYSTLFAEMAQTVGALPEDRLKRFYGSTDYNDSVEGLESLMGLLYFRPTEERLRHYETWTRSLLDAPLMRGYKGPPLQQYGTTRIFEGASQIHFDIHHQAEETNSLTWGVQLAYGEPLYIETLVRQIWNANDNMCHVYPGVDNWMQRDANRDWWLMKAPRFNSNHVGFQFPNKTPFDGHDSIEMFDVLNTVFALRWFYGPNHYLWAGSENRFAGGRVDAWIDRTVAEIGTKPALIPPGHILSGWSLDGYDPSRFGVVKSDWGWSITGSSGYTGGWYDGGDTELHFYGAMAMLAPYDQDANDIVQHGYCQRQAGATVPGHQNSRFTHDSAHLAWIAQAHRHDRDYDCDTAALARAYKDEVMRAIALRIEEGRGSHGSADGHRAMLFRYAADRVEDLLAAWRNTANPELIKWSSLDGLLYGITCGAGVYDIGTFTGRIGVDTRSDDIALSCVSQSPSWSTYYAYNRSGSTRQMSFRALTNDVNALWVRVGQDSDRDRAFDSGYQSTRLSAQRGTDRVFSVPPGESLIKVKSEFKQNNLDPSTRPDPAIGRWDSIYDVEQGRAHFRIHNLGPVPVTGLVVRMRTRNGANANDQLIDMDGFTGKDPVTRWVSWEIAREDIRELVIDPGGEVTEITEANNKLIPSFLP